MESPNPTSSVPNSEMLFFPPPNNFSHNVSLLGRLFANVVIISVIDATPVTDSGLISATVSANCLIKGPNATNSVPNSDKDFSPMIF